MESPKNGLPSATFAIKNSPEKPKTVVRRGNKEAPPTISTPKSRLCAKLAESNAPLREGDILKKKLLFKGTSPRGSLKIPDPQACVSLKETSQENLNSTNNSTATPVKISSKTSVKKANTRPPVPKQ